MNMIIISYSVSYVYMQEQYAAAENNLQHLRQEFKDATYRLVFFCSISLTHIYKSSS